MNATNPLQIKRLTFNNFQNQTGIPLPEGAKEAPPAVPDLCRGHGVELRQLLKLRVDKMHIRNRPRFTLHANRLIKVQIILMVDPTDAADQIGTSQLHCFQAQRLRCPGGDEASGDNRCKIYHVLLFCRDQSPSSAQVCATG